MANEPEIIDVPRLIEPKRPSDTDDIDPELLAKAEALVAGLQPQYLTWVQEDLDRLQVALDGARAAEAAGRAEAMQPVFAIAHDIKGQGGSFGYPLITEIGGQLCGLLDGRLDFAEEVLEVVGLHVEAMRLVVAERMEGDGGKAGQRLKRGLQAVIAKIGG